MSTRHEFLPQHYFHCLGPYEPVLRVQPGDTVVTRTVDARGFNAQRQQITPRGNPQTGPFYVEGAEPGDTLVVRLLNIRPDRSFGWAHSVLAPNTVDPTFVPDLPDNSIAEWDIDVEAGIATLVSPVTDLGPLVIPLEPMIGCFGVAPSRKQAISTATAGEHGGNMDYRGFTAGTTVYFPIFEPGGLFFLGDVHAAQGCGEITGNGIEVSAEVEFQLDLLPETCHWPRGENGDYYFTVGNARPLDQALQHATTEMLRWLEHGFGLSPLAAHLLMSQCVRYDLGNVFDPAYSMVCKLARRWLDERLPGDDSEANTDTGLSPDIE